MSQKQKNFKRKLEIRKANAIFTILAIVTIFMVLSAIDIYRLTIITSSYLFGVSAIGGIITFFTLRNWLKRIYSFVLIFVISFPLGGGLFYSGFLFLNQVFHNRELVTKEFQIVKAGNFGGRNTGCSEPFVVIDFHGIRKQLVFPCTYEKTISNYHKVALTYSKGFFGFETIASKELTL